MLVLLSLLRLNPLFESLLPKRYLNQQPVLSGHVPVMSGKREPDEGYGPGSESQAVTLLNLRAVGWPSVISSTALRLARLVSAKAATICPFAVRSPSIVSVKFVALNLLMAVVILFCCELLYNA